MIEFESNLEFPVDDFPPFISHVNATNTCQTKDMALQVLNVGEEEVLVPLQVVYVANSLVDQDCISVRTRHRRKETTLEVEEGDGEYEANKDEPTEDNDLYFDPNDIVDSGFDITKVYDDLFKDNVGV
jgi:hypothetical protein